ncbi:MAG: DUF45 domain-containing protein [Nitrospirae bacterium]|nr:DUF45 domain-containing protein [Nitrospirota bacterium]
MSHDSLSLKAYLEEVSGKSVTLKVTNNSTSMLSVKSSVKSAVIRINQIFLDADVDVIDEIGAFLKNTKGKTPLIRQYINKSVDSIRNVVDKKITTIHQGKHYNLLSLYNNINEEYFSGAVKAIITWGKKSAKQRVKTRRLGSFHNPSNVIRINTVLDKSTIPPYVIEYVVYHEMLHAYIGVAMINGKRYIHTIEFKRREMLFREYTRAVAFLKSKVF